MSAAARREALLRLTGDRGRVLLAPLFAWQDEDPENAYSHEFSEDMTGYFDVKLRVDVGPYAAGAEFQTVQVNWTLGHIIFLEAMDDDFEDMEEDGRAFRFALHGTRIVFGPELSPDQLRPTFEDRAALWMPYNDDQYGAGVVLDD